MGKNRPSQLKSGVLLSYIQMALNIVVGVIYTPIMIRMLGQSEYGLYNTVLSTISMLSILNLGFSNGYIRYYSRYVSTGDRDAVKRLNGLFLIIFSVIGLVAFACGMLLTFNLELVFDSGLTPSEYETARILMLLLTINMTASFPMSVFSSIISAHEKFVILKLLQIFNTLAKPIVSTILLIVGYKSIALAVAVVLISFLIDIVYLFYVLFVLRENFCFKGIDKSLFWGLFSYTAFIAVHIIVDQVNWNVDRILLGRFKGSESVAIYTVGYSLFQYYMSFSTSISGVFSPRIHNIINRNIEKTSEMRRELSDLFIKVGRIQFAVLGLIASGLIIFGKPFIAYWAGEGYEESYYVLIVLVIFGMIDLIQNTGIEIQRALNLHKFRAYIYAAMALINVTISIFLCQKYGAAGCAVGTAISLLVANGIVMNIYYYKKCGIDIVLFWKNILRMLVGMLIPIAVGVVMFYVDYSSVLKLLLYILIYAVIYCVSIFLFSLNQYERSLVLKPLKTIRNFFNSKFARNKVGGVDNKSQ